MSNGCLVSRLTIYLSLRVSRGYLRSLTFVSYYRGVYGFLLSVDLSLYFVRLLQDVFHGSVVSYLVLLFRVYAFYETNISLLFYYFRLFRSGFICGLSFSIVATSLVGNDFFCYYSRYKGYFLYCLVFNLRYYCRIFSWDFRFRFLFLRFLSFLCRQLSFSLGKFSIYGDRVRL